MQPDTGLRGSTLGQRCAHAGTRAIPSYSQRPVTRQPSEQPAMLRIQQTCTQPTAQQGWRLHGMSEAAMAWLPAAHRC